MILNVVHSISRTFEEYNLTTIIKVGIALNLISLLKSTCTLPITHEFISCC
jgi:hypothetical protein